MAYELDPVRSFRAVMASDTICTDANTNEPSDQTQTRTNTEQFEREWSEIRRRTRGLPQRRLGGRGRRGASSGRRASWPWPPWPWSPWPASRRRRRALPWSPRRGRRPPPPQGPGHRRPRQSTLQRVTEGRGERWCCLPELRERCVS
uniref:Uncharacterized protein n=1 Tax=Triticum urartu TaxID=4572 RepID=A0A8R7QC32_TRIUA